MKSVPFQTSHWAELTANGLPLGVELSQSEIQQIEATGKAHTIVDEKGVPLACGGVVQYWKGRFEAWAIFDKERAKSRMVGIIRIMRDFLARVRGRVEAAVRIGNFSDLRTALVLGFAMETLCAKCYLPDGADCSILVRIS